MTNRNAFQFLVFLWFMLLNSIANLSTSASDSTLADAIEAGDFQTAKQLLAGETDADVTQSNASQVNSTQPDGMTALHWAVWRDEVELTAMLLQKKADANAETRYGVTPLSIACVNGNAEIVRRLIAAGANANSTLPSSETPLMLAARTGLEEPVKLLLTAGAEVNARDRSEQSAIMWAAAEGHAAVVKLLIAAGADLKTPLKSGFTPLMFAAREGKLEAARVLLEAGADVNEAMMPKQTGGKHPRTGMSPLLMAVENGHFDLAIEFIKAGADTNDQRSGFTPLHTLTWVRKPNLGDSADGDPAPEGSGSLTSLDFVRQLVALGADPNIRLERGSSGRGKLNHKGATPFLLAARTNDLPLMKLLLELGADPTLNNTDNCTPLLTAAGIGTLAPGEEAGTEEEALEAVKFLLSIGADINHVDDNGETAMHGATYKSLPKMVALLASSGARIDIWNRRNKYGWTPVLIAEGHRPGNFKPAAETLEAVHQVMRAAGVAPPPRTPRQELKGYDQQ
jgi:uncharacterized protein